LYVIVVYDTAAERNPKILRTCRRYLHHVQRSVFEGHLSAAQVRRFHAAVLAAIVTSYDSVLACTFPQAPPPSARNGAPQPAPSDIL
jgi:CRISPR-associated protein Cas2